MSHSKVKLPPSFSIMASAVSSPLYVSTVMSSSVIFISWVPFSGDISSGTLNKMSFFSSAFSLSIMNLMNASPDSEISSKTGISSSLSSAWRVCSKLPFSSLNELRNLRSSFFNFILTSAEVTSSCCLFKDALSETVFLSLLSLSSLSVSHLTDTAVLFSAVLSLFSAEASSKENGIIVTINMTAIKKLTVRFFTLAFLFIFFS